VWTEQGSPLLLISQRQATALQAMISMQYAAPIRVELAMRYGQPSVAAGLKRLQAAGVHRLLILPLYPQYSAAATASTFDAVAAVLKTWRWLPELRFINSYHDDIGYIKTIADSIRTAWQQRERPERLLFSFHGLPKDYFIAGDPYYCQCQKTARLVATELGLSENSWQVTFQSRLGPREWLQPYTDVSLRELALAKVRNVDIVCPGFAADCLETLEEIQLQNRDIFLQAGGARFNYIPALNATPEHIAMLANLIGRHIQGWPEADPQWHPDEHQAQERLERAKRLGASD
jgi:ferrochelatase